MNLRSTSTNITKFINFNYFISCILQTISILSHMKEILFSGIKSTDGSWKWMGSQRQPQMELNKTKGANMYRNIYTHTTIIDGKQALIWKR